MSAVREKKCSIVNGRDKKRVLVYCSMDVRLLSMALLMRAFKVYELVMELLSFAMNFGMGGDV